MFKITVFSKMEGVVTKGGRPVEGAVVKRSADHYNDKVYSDQAVTGKDGRFSFGAISTWSLRPIIFDTVVLQEITIEFEGKIYLGWEMFKHNNHHHGELVNKDKKSKAPIRCTFELNHDDRAEQVAVLDEIRHRVIRGLCKLQ